MRQYVACPEQLDGTANRRRCAGTRYVDGVMLLVAGGIEPWYAWRNRWFLRYLLKTGRVLTDDKWPGNLFHTVDAAEENDFEETIEVFLKGAEIVTEPEDLSGREGVYLGRISAR